jgi:peptidoglycan/LPS O-acetylase OafA/YrhL
MDAGRCSTSPRHRSSGIGHESLAPYVLMPCRADALLLGALCAWMVRQQYWANVLVRHRKALYSAFAILLLGAATLTIKYPSIKSFGMISFGYSWLALLYTFFLLIAVTEKRGIIRNIATIPLLGRLGMVAYGVYLFHQGMMGLTHGLILHQWPKIQGFQDLMVSLLAFVLTLALAYLSWNFFEKRLVAIGHRFHYQIDGTSARLHHHC